MRDLHLVIPSIGRPTCRSVVRESLARETRLSRLTVVNQSDTQVVDASLRADARRRCVHLEEIALDRRVGPAKARDTGASQGDEEFVGFLDDDISFEAGSLSALVELCRARNLGGAGGVVTGWETGRIAALLKVCLFRSIFTDRRQWAARSNRPQPTTILSGGIGVYRRSLYRRRAAAWTSFDPDRYGEDVELSFVISRCAPLMLDPSVRVRNSHVELSRGPSDPTAGALAHLERYRSFAQRHAATPAHRAAYVGVLGGVLVRGLSRGARWAFVRAVAAEAARAATTWGAGGGQRGPALLELGRDDAARPTVGAVIVFFHSDHVILDCVRSLAAQSRPPDLVAVVANSPVPGPIAAELRALGTLVVGEGTNRGFAAAANEGAARLDVDLLWFVNPDVGCDPTCLDRLLRWAGDDTVAAPLLRLPDGSREPSGKRGRYLSPGVLLARELLLGRLIHLGQEPAASRPSEITSASGACLLVPRSAFLSVGGFDHRYFLYGEDVDLCLRLRGAGIRIVTVPEARATHASGTGSGRRNAETDEIKGREARRSNYLLLRRFGSEADARNYLAGLLPVLRLRMAVARLVSPSVLRKDRAAYTWARSGVDIAAVGDADEVPYTTTTLSSSA